MRTMVTVIDVGRVRNIDAYNVFVDRSLLYRPVDRSEREYRKTV